MKHACEARLAAAEEEKRLALERQLLELTGSAEEQIAMREEKEKEARVELLRRQMVRRMMNASTANAWGAWVELWEAKTYAMGRLLEVRNRLSQPELSKAFGFWARWCEGESRKIVLSAAQERESRLAIECERLRGELTGDRTKWEAKVSTLSAERLRLLEEVARLSGGAAESEALLEVEREHAREERVELLRRQMVRRMTNAGLADAWIAWVEFWEEKT